MERYARNAENEMVENILVASGNTDTTTTHGSNTMEDNWWVERLMEDGRLSELEIRSEYEKGFIDCWNKLWKYENDEKPFW